MVKKIYANAALMLRDIIINDDKNGIKSREKARSTKKVITAEFLCKFSHRWFVWWIKSIAMWQKRKAWKLNFSAPKIVCNSLVLAYWKWIFIVEIFLLRDMWNMNKAKKVIKCTHCHLMKGISWISFIYGGGYIERKRPDDLELGIPIT